MSTIKPSVANGFADHIPFHRPVAEIERIAAAWATRRPMTALSR